MLRVQQRGSSSRKQSYVATGVIVDVAETRDLELERARDLLGVGEDGVNIVVTHFEMLIMVGSDFVRD